ncbi:AAA family ATPase [Streptomyces sp. A7024]|uniref:AAA family ATPase n=1 Tax=Streptomyces coryli TaxID=1128680 RepID=A0A6G4UC22_9ACTN|nr:LuxR family transcriptional regulator [Streptomyces coryli]NGN69562.1 AAA family ATPase [Streptomyces coryli]
MMLYGRGTELAELDQVLAAACAGESRALVLRGEAGIGKSTLLAEVVERARGSGMTILRATGAEGERDLAFAGLLQLLRPVADRAEQLPGPQADAVRAALGTGSAREHDRFLTGLAVLSLLAEVAEDGPVLVLIDDAQWLDEQSTQALQFAARRLAAEGVAMVFATRDDERYAGAGLPELALSRLRDEDALALLAGLDVPAEARIRLLAEADGNPLALAEFAAAAGREGGGLPGSVMTPVPAADRVLARFRARIAGLPERTRLMLLFAAAEAQGVISYLLPAAESLGVGLADLAEAEAQGLVEVAGGRVTFRHPLVRTAAYLGAPMARRVAVHQALAATSTDPDCTAGHRAAAAMGPDEDVAAELEAYAQRTLDRGGTASAAATYAQAARLTPDPAERARRLTAGAWAAQQSGHAEQAASLAERAYPMTADPVERAELAYIRSFWFFEKDEPVEGGRLLLDHGPDATPRRAAAMLRTAGTYGWFGGDAATLCRAAELLEKHGDGSAADAAVRGLALIADEDYERGLPLVAGLLDPVPADGHARLFAISLSSLLADDAVLPLITEEIERARVDGLIGRLPYLLHVQARLQLYAGRHRDAEATAAEGAAIARDTGLRARMERLDNLLARIAAIAGDEDRVRSLVTDSLTADGNYGRTAWALLDLGLGRYEAALTRLEEARTGSVRHSAALLFAAADQVEAAVRLGAPDRAVEPARRFAAWAAASGRPWAQAVALRNEALLTDTTDPYERAVKLHAEGSPASGRPFEQARTELLYGEHLRRARRRADAREQLRSALAAFERLDAAPWAERARAELRATGETLASERAAAPALVDRLTPQELQVTRLAAEGVSSREIAARLFLSPRTVEYHLYKAYPKLGIANRRELAGLDLSG